MLLHNLKGAVPARKFLPKKQLDYKVLCTSEKRKKWIKINNGVLEIVRWLVFLGEGVSNRTFEAVFSSAITSGDNLFVDFLLPLGLNRVWN